MDERPVVLVLDKDRKRSPLLSLFYDQISRIGSPLNVIRVGDGKNKEALLDFEDSEGSPDYVHLGWSVFEKNNTGTIELCQEIAKLNVKVIIDILDIEAFIGANKADNIFSNSCDVDYFVLHTADPKKCYSIDKIQNIISNKLWAKDTKVIYVPWGVDPTRKTSLKERKNDVAFVCDLNSGWRFHKNRFKIKEVLESLSGNVKVRIGNWWGLDYENILSHTKILVVDGSMRAFMTQKYLEGPLFGAMLMGDIPINSAGIFEDGKSIVGITDLNEMKDRILYYLINDWEREEIAAEAQERVLSSFTIDQTAKEYERTLMRDWRD